MDGTWTLRPLTYDDTTVVTALVNAGNRMFRDEDVFTPGELESILRFPSTDPERDARLLVDDQGAAVGAVFVTTSEPWSTAQLHLSLKPTSERPAAITLLLDAGARIAASRPELLPNASFDVESVLHEDTMLRDELKRRGFALTRTVTQMTRSLDDVDLDTEPRWPTGISVETIRPDDVEQLRSAAEVSREAFSDHDGDYVTPVDDFLHMVQTMPTVRPDLSLLALDDVGAVGLALNSVTIDKEPCGYVGTLGVVRRARGQGLGKALLHESFRRFRATGWHQAKLHVQVGNRTGADRLYRSVGMSSGTVDECWSLPLAAVR